MLHTKFQASEPSGFEVKDLLIFYVFLWFNLGPPGGGILGPGTFFGINLVIDHQVILDTIFQAPELSSSGEEDF